jgi:hypothetical protein
MSSALYALLIGGVLAAVTGFLVVQNRRTPVPEGCENLKPDCKACGIMDCAVRQEGGEEKGKDAETK